VPVAVQVRGPVLVEGSELQLRRLVANLLDNAARHAATAVEVAVTASAGTARLEVGDDGPGIPVEHRHRVFERFTRLDEARDRGHGGAGLGLAIVLGIARAHRGTVRVEDRAPGAHLTVELPVARGAAEPDG
jgi:signal transduction histidine kinase